MRLLCVVVYGFHDKKMWAIILFPFERLPEVAMPLLRCTAFSWSSPRLLRILPRSRHATVSDRSHVRLCSLSSLPLLQPLPVPRSATRMMWPTFRR